MHMATCAGLCVLYISSARALARVQPYCSLPRSRRAFYLSTAAAIAAVGAMHSLDDYVMCMYYAAWGDTVLRVLHGLSVGPSHLAFRTACPLMHQMYAGDPKWITMTTLSVVSRFLFCISQFAGRRGRFLHMIAQALIMALACSHAYTNGYIAVLSFLCTACLMFFAHVRKITIKQ